MDAISCQNVSFSYQTENTHVPILHQVDLQVKKGEFVAIQGPSGSGKSTLLYLLGLLAKPNTGEVYIFGKRASDAAEDVLSRLRHDKIGFVFQQFHLLPKATVLENILLPSEYSHSNESTLRQFRARAQSLGERFGLGDRLNHRPNELSGGQQQRVAIARALLNEPDLILADEPTGNLDSQSAQLILSDLRKLNKEQGKTVIIITHDQEVAKACDRTVHIKDGRIEGEHLKGGVDFSTKPIAIAKTQFSAQKEIASNELASMAAALRDSFNHFEWREFSQTIPRSMMNLKRQKLRSLLTMMGIMVGVAAIFSMITLGQFTKSKILAGYSDLGVDTAMFYGNPNWRLRATEQVPVVFQDFVWERDLLPLKRIFTDIVYMSPVMVGWNATVSFAGKSMDQDVRLLGVNEDAIFLTRRKIMTGRNFLPLDIQNHQAVCIIGYEVGSRLFVNINPIGQLLAISEGDNLYSCRIIGVLEPIQGSKDYLKPNNQVIMPYTYYQALAGEWWSSRIYQMMFQVRQGADPVTIGKSIEVFFKKKYGESGQFRMDSDSVLLTQMNRFLTLFTILLSSIAFVTLFVGGMGITNMMLVSVSERYREIGLRRALGASPQSIRLQFLSESILICTLAGAFGLFFGFIGYSSAIWAGTKFMSQLTFEWTLNGTAFLISFFAIFGVGLVSGLFPALKAERLQVIEALRSD